MEKTLRVLSGDDEGGHSHTHSHSLQDDPQTAETTAVATSVSGNGLRSRKGEKVNGDAPKPAKASSGPSKSSAYLNLLGDFVHNMYVDQ
jgi:zinc transporter 7